MALVLDEGGNLVYLNPTPGTPGQIVQYAPWNPQPTPYTAPPPMPEPAPAASTKTGSAPPKATSLWGSINGAKLIPGLKPLGGGQYGNTQLSWGATSPYLTELFNQLKKQFPGITNGGGYVVKEIQGGSTMSQHSYGSALDIMVPNTAVGNAIYHWIEQNWPFATSPVNKILWDPLGHPGNNPGQHTNHLHVEIDPVFLNKPLPAWATPQKQAPAQQGPDMATILATIKHFESGGNYKAQNPNSTASGAYQFTHDTWNNYGGYAEAYLAPPSVQDARAKLLVNQILGLHNGDVNWVPASWYAGIQGAMNKPWSQNPNPGAGNVSTIQQYHDKWMSFYNSQVGGTPMKTLPLPEPSPAYEPADHQLSIALSQPKPFVSAGSLYGIQPGVSM